MVQSKHHAQLVEVHFALVDAVDLLVLQRITRLLRCSGEGAGLTLSVKHSTRFCTYHAPSFLPLTMLSLAACKERHSRWATGV